MTLSITGLYSLCAHGLRYCLECQTAQPKDIPPEHKWLEANKTLASLRKPKGEVATND